MSHPAPTTESSAVQDEVQQYFERFASNAFDRCWSAHCKANFYTKLLADLKQGRVFSEELSEAEGLPISVQRSVIQKLLKQAATTAESAWELPSEVGREFRTTIRSGLPRGESIPQYDIEYCYRKNSENAKIQIQTWRRSISVVLLGDQESLDHLHSSLITTLIKNS